MQHHLQFIQKFAQCVSETFKQFAQTIRKERSRTQALSKKLNNNIGAPIKLASTINQVQNNQNNQNSQNNQNNQNNQNSHSKPQNLQQTSKQSLYLQSQQQQQKKSTVPPTPIPPRHLQPFRPQNAFSIFISQQRKQILQSNPTLQFLVVTQQITQQWKSMNEQQKKPYIEKYQQLKKNQLLVKQQQNKINQNNNSVMNLTSISQKSTDGLKSKLSLKPMMKMFQLQQDDCFDDILPEAQRKKKEIIKLQKIKEKQEQMNKKVIQQVNIISQTITNALKQQEQLIKQNQQNNTQNNKEKANKQNIQQEQQIKQINEIILQQPRQQEVIVHKKIQEVNNFQDLLNQNVLIHQQQKQLQQKQNQPQQQIKPNKSNNKQQILILQQNKQKIQQKFLPQFIQHHQQQPQPEQAWNNDKNEQQLKPQNIENNLNFQKEQGQVSLNLVESNNQNYDNMNFSQLQTQTPK